MLGQSNLRATILAARQGLTEGREQLRARHVAGESGMGLNRAWCEVLDQSILRIWEAALADLDPTGELKLLEQVALVAHGGFGRQDPAPFSDVDLMLLHTPEIAEGIPPLAGRLLRDIGDIGLTVGHSVRTTLQACQLAVKDAVIATSLMESRLLAGNQPLYDHYLKQFSHTLHRRANKLFLLIEDARLKERLQYGETVYLLEPNLKRSKGGLRDLQLLRWVGFLFHGSTDPAVLEAKGILTVDDRLALAEAHEFLLRLRNEMHFHAKRAKDVLDRQEQIRIATARGFTGSPGVLPVEAFMQEYFRNTQAISHRVNHFVDGMRPGAWKRNITMLVLSHRVDRDYWVGPSDVRATPAGAQHLQQDLAGVWRLAELANTYNRPIEYHTCEALRQGVSQLPTEVTQEVSDRFLKFLNYPTRLGGLLRQLHEIGALERVLPEYTRVRGLLQFNEVHKFTVDEHSILAVEEATHFMDSPDLPGRLYPSLPNKWLLHLALLVHDLGKGLDGDHSKIGAEIAARTAARLHLSDEDSELLVFLVQYHLKMTELAFRRDVRDSELVVRFAVEMQSPERLRLLYLLTVADMRAVAPGIWNRWKGDLLEELYTRTMQYLSGDRDALEPESKLSTQRDELRALCGTDLDPWLERQIATLPSVYLHAKPLEEVLAELRQLRQLPAGEILADARHLAETDCVEYTIATYESVSPGIFHKLAGALATKGLEILSAEIYTLDHNLVIDRFFVRDPDFNGAPPDGRLQEICAALKAALRDTKPPPLDRARRYGRSARSPEIPSQLPTQVRIDNSTSQHFTILDVFAADRPGLLYAIGRTLFELELSVVLAKISTHLDQVVDVFYVTDAAGKKLTDEDRLRKIRSHLVSRIESFVQQPFKVWDAQAITTDVAASPVNI